MTKLSDAQLVVLSAACQREDRCALPVTHKLKGNAAAKVLKSLLAKGLLVEAPGRAGDTVWRQTDEGPLTLRATDAALAALGIETAAEPLAEAGDEAAPPKPAKKQRSVAAKKPTSNKAKAKAQAAEPRATRSDSKQARLIQMLKRSKGASIAEIVEAFGWQPHTVRGAIAGALKKKLGLNVTSEKVEGRGRVYRVAA